VAANSGSVGLVSYLVLIGFSIFIFVQKPKINKSTNLQISNKSINSQIKNSELAESWQVEIDSLRFALFAGYISLSVTNFFGFSVVPTQLEFFLFPAIAIVIAAQSTEYKVQSRKLETIQKFFIVLVLCTMFYVLFAVGKYWFADTLYAKGKAFNSVQKPDSALIYLNRAISLEPAQALYHNELSGSYTTIALYYYQQKDTSKAKEFTNLATSESDKAIALSPANVNLKRSRFGVFVTLSQIDPNYLINARDTLIDAINYAPTDAKLYYNLGLIYARIGQGDLATKTLQKTIDLKSNYREARLAYAILLIDKKQNAEAKTQLEYILRNIDPNDSLTKQTLESLK
jgi:tetratricopeptide (TPR) repeat protein